MEDTIAAISTSTVSSGGISVVRISGENALSVAQQVFRSKKNKNVEDMESHTVHYGNIYNGKELIDEVLMVVMKAPNTYTREDVVEIDCHGGILVTKKVLEAVLSAGARLAEPGEFTKRAFLNGRIDLSQAEAVIDVIQSKNEYALKSSVRQLSGKLSEKIKGLRELVLNNVAYIEAALDDPEHISLDNYVNKLSIDVDKCVDNVDNLLKTCDNGRIAKEGIRTVILGKTNAGKSSLLNALAKEERAIVTDIEGTTRDTLEEQITIGGIQLNLIFVVDSTRTLDENDKDIISLIQDKKVITLLNKSDLTPVVTPEEMKKRLDCCVIPISAKEETGLDKLEDAIKELFFSGNLELNEDIYIANQRQKQLLIEAKEAFLLVKDGIESGMSEDFLTIDLMTAYEKLGYIIGEEVEDDLADKIFKSFCMGK